ncbi:restriction endonuclease subunit S [Enterobacter sp. 168J2]|uniref:restriction endonuclease subunit S n=1 Tax=Enterobacter sp. 168J2 TaxID=3077758 RepID=UPI0020A10063|nr:restriction endonuclease subunit S [Enterobacter sp. 168J2]MCP1115556.1 restriction endonuclease subunit S [Enterobacter bugandensis]HBU6131651.1 restriction endonuclease subunit S [Enterobacter cloacae]
MSGLNFLNKLLDGVDVEWVTLGSIADIGTGSSNRQDESDNGTYPFFVRSKNILKSDTFEFDEVAIVIPGEGGVGDIFHYVEGKYALHQRAYRISIQSNSLITKFVYHFMLSSFKQYILMKSVGATAISIRKPMLEGFQVPIPCPDQPEKSLAIQSEIVRILDKFNSLTAELIAELTMRKKQYNYYRDQLMNLEEREDTREMSIGDIYDFQYGTGNTIPKSGGQYPVYGSNGIVGSHDKYNSEDSPVIGHIGAYAGIVNWGQGKHFVTYNGVICRHKSKEVLQKYAYHLLLLQDFGSKSNSASQPFVSYNILNAPIVLVPPLQEQARIVAILDKFDTLTSSITEGLPREIELRQKQYEYYRDLLFSFPTSEAASN